MNKQRKIILLMLLALLCAAAFEPIGNSLETLRVMTEGSRLYMVFKNDSGQELVYDSGSLSLNGQELTGTGVGPLSSSDLPLSTLFLVDVSKTVLGSETARAKDAAEIFRTNPVFAAQDRSRYFLQTFGDVVSQVSGPYENPALLVSDLKYEAGTSDYYHAISEALDFMQSRIDSGIAENNRSLSSRTGSVFRRP